MKKKKYIISLVALFFLILGFQYKVEYDIRKQTPSDKWSKEVLISKGDVTTFPKILKSDKNNIIAFNDADKLKLVVTDDLGKKLEEKTFDTKGAFIKELNFLKGKDNFYLSWKSYENGSDSLKTITLDKNFNEVEQTKIENVTETYQIGEDILVIGHKDKVEVLDMAKNSKLNINIKGASIFSGVKTEKGFMLTYSDGKDGFNYITVDNGVASSSKLAGVLNKSVSMEFLRSATSVDSKDGYLLIEYSVKGEFAGTRCLRFALDGSSNDSSELYINNNKHIYNVIGVKSKEGASFFATTDRVFGIKDWQQDIVEFTLENNKVTTYTYASRLHGQSTYPGTSEDTILYASYNKPGEMGVYIASQDEEFKKANNIPLSFEKKQAVVNTFQGFIYSLIYIIYPIKWIISALVLMSIMTFFSYRLSNKKKKAYFLLVSIITFALKMSGIIANSYGENIYLLPQILAHKWVAVLISLVITLVSYGFGYELYKEDLEVLAIGKFSIALVIDTILTMMVFVPFFITL